MTHERKRKKIALDILTVNRCKKKERATDILFEAFFTSENEQEKIDEI